VAGEGQVDGDDEELPCPVLEDLIAQQQTLAALCHDDEQRLGQRMVRLRALHPR
jgi:hypothetical protein